MNSTKIKIIHVEDLRSDADLVERELKKSGLKFDLLLVANKKDFEKALNDFKADIIICDHSLPSFSSSEAFKMARTKSEKIPFILVTATVSEEFAVDMMKEGVNDYILKDRLQRLPGAINNALGKVKSESEKENYLQEIISREKKFSALIEKNYDAICLADENFMVFYRSPSVYRIFNWTPEELENTNTMLRVHPDDQENLKKELVEIIATPGGSFRTKFRMLNKTGEYLWLDGTITNLLKDPDIKALVMNFRDVSEHKRSEEALIKSGEHFKALIENISDAIILVGQEGHIIYNSPAVKRITGLDNEDTKNKRVFDFCHPEDITRSAKVFENSLKHPGVPLYSSIRIRHKNGNFIWVEGTVNNLLHNKSVNAIIISYRDVTERKVAQELLQKSEATLQSIVKNAKLAYVLVNKEFKILSFNETAFSGYLKEFRKELHEGAYLFDYLPEERQSQTMASYTEVLKGNKLKYETNFVQENGFLSWYSMNVFPVFDEIKQVLGLIISTEDITDRRNAEIEKEKMTEDIIRHNKNLEQFAYIISHNLRSPVANILGLTYVLNNSPQMSPADHQKCMDGLVTSVKKLDDVIIDLNFILQKRREISEKREMIDLGTLVSDIEMLIDNEIKKENASIITDFTEIKELYSIKSYLNSIFLNLITNSIKYKKPNHNIQIEITAKRENNKLNIHFKDNGLGIDLNAYGDKLFGLYKKFHHQVEGKGMGLYMVKTQVELLGGKISVDSTVNEGTTFTLQFHEG